MVQRTFEDGLGPSHGALGSNGAPLTWGSHPKGDRDLHKARLIGSHKASEIGLTVGLVCKICACPAAVKECNIAKFGTTSSSAVYE
jgi:hypothetical protein